MPSLSCCVLMLATPSLFVSSQYIEPPNNHPRALTSSLQPPLSLIPVIPESTSPPQNLQSPVRPASTLQPTTSSVLSPETPPNPSKIPWLHEILIGVSHVHKSQPAAQLDFIDTLLFEQWWPSTGISNIWLHYRIPHHPNLFIHQLGKTLRERIVWDEPIKVRTPKPDVDVLDLEVLFERHVDFEKILEIVEEKLTPLGMGTDWKSVKVFLPSEGTEVAERMGRQVVLELSGTDVVETLALVGRLRRIMVYVGVESREVVPVQPWIYRRL